MTPEELYERAQAYNGTRKTRVITLDDCKEMLDLAEKHAADPSIKTIRIYSADGFVANSYKYRCDITILQATRNEDGTWHFGAGQVDAKRPHGKGPRVTINSRGA